MAQIWIVEDDPPIGKLIEMAMQKDGHETLRVLEDAELERAVRNGKKLPDLLLLDLMLRAKNGYQILREWKQDRERKNVPVIIISARGAEQDKVRGLELGAEDYITKPFGVRELQARVRAALRRLPAARERLCVGGLILNPETHETQYLGRRVELTRREFELLLYLARHAEETVSRGTLLREVWGYATADDPSRTVDSHIRTLRVKLGDTEEESRMIMTVRGAGYRLTAGEQT